VLDAIAGELPASEIVYARGCGVDDRDRSGFEQAVTAARDADVAVVVVGDRAGLFGRGTSGEGCDAESLELPGVQRELVEAVLSTGTPVVLVLLTGRPYAVGWALDACAAVVQAFFPGEEGAAAIAGVISGRINPSGRLPVSLPRSAGSQPYSYLHPLLGGPSSVSNLDPEPLRPFGYGLSFTTFAHRDLRVATAAVPTDGLIEVSVVAANTGLHAGADVVQLYAHDAVASVTRPVAQLLGYARVVLEPGQAAVIRFSVPTTRVAFSGRDLFRAVEPGTLDLWVGRSCAERETQASVELVGEPHPITSADARWVDVVVEPRNPDPVQSATER
jgi:beta-glucosidase